MTTTYQINSLGEHIRGDEYVDIVPSTAAELAAFDKWLAVHRAFGHDVFNVYACVEDDQQIVELLLFVSPLDNPDAVQRIAELVDPYGFGLLEQIASDTYFLTLDVTTLDLEDIDQRRWDAYRAVIDAGLGSHIVTIK